MGKSQNLKENSFIFRGPWDKRKFEGLKKKVSKKIK